VLDQRRVSQERVIGISFVDILIQAVFVLLVALFVGYVDPTVKIDLENQAEYGQVGKDLCHKLNKDSVEACREYVEGRQVTVEVPKKNEFQGVGEHICRTLGATNAEECRKVSDRELARLRPCLKPVSEFSVPPSLTLILKNPKEIEFVGFSTNLILKYREESDRVRLARVEELDRSKGASFSPNQVLGAFGFILERNCYHVVHTRRPGAFSDSDLQDVLAAVRPLREPLQ